MDYPDAAHQILREHPPAIMKDCFGTVISSLKEMKECVRCELLVECRSLNWRDGEPSDPPAITRSRGSGSGEDGGTDDPASGTLQGAGS